MSFTKLDSGIVMSTVWQEPDHVLRVWITLLALSDARGRVFGSVPGLAHTATKTVTETEDALGRLMAPDPYSRTRDHAGRRIEVIEGGWQILNYTKYREARDPDTRREQTRRAVARHRDRVNEPKNVSQCKPEVSQGKPKKAQAEAEAEAEAEEEPPPAAPPPRARATPRPDGSHPLIATSAACAALTHRGREALGELLDRSARPTALLAEVAMVLQGGRPNVPSYPEAVSLALADLTLTTGAVSGLMLRTFVQRAALHRHEVAPTRSTPLAAHPPNGHHRRAGGLSDPLDPFRVAHAQAVAERLAREAQDREHVPAESG